MTQADLITTLKASLGGAAGEFTAAADADFIRHLSYAARDYSRRRPLKQLGELTLEAGTAEYAGPADLLWPDYPLWGQTERDKVALWDRTAVHELPRLSQYKTADGTIMLRLRPAPTAAQITCFGAAYKFFYSATHIVSGSTVTIPDGDELLLITRAQAEAAKELAERNVTHPVGPWKNGLQSVPKPMTPLALHEALMKTFEALAA